MRAAAAILLLALCGTAEAEELRLGAGTGVIHHPGLALASVKAGPLWAGAWEENAAAGLTWDIGGASGWRAELGALYALHTDGDVGTNLNALLRAGYCWKRACFMFTHISHGASLGIADERPNSGLNFLSLELRLTVE